MSTDDIERLWVPIETLLRKLLRSFHNARATLNRNIIELFNTEIHRRLRYCLMRILSAASRCGKANCVWSYGLPQGIHDNSNNNFCEVGQRPPRHYASFCGQSMYPLHICLVFCALYWCCMGLMTINNYGWAVCSEWEALNHTIIAQIILCDDWLLFYYSATLYNTG